MLYVPVHNAQNGRLAVAARRRGAVVVPGCTRSFADMLRTTWQAPSTIGKDHGQRPEEAPYG